MKSFAAAAIAASTASAFDAMAVPDFVAGFVYGMTGDNHLTEIEACYQGGEQIVTDTKTALGDFTSGDFFKGIKDAGTAWNEVGSAMTTCKGMDEDIAAIEAWAQIFTEPTKLAKTVGKRWLLHGRTIKKDIAQEESDWSAGNYFDAGKDTALALTEAVGPINSAAVNAAMNGVPAPILFVAGMFDGLIVDSDLTEITTCVTDGESTVADVEALLADFEAGNMIKAARLAKKLASEFPATLSACEGMGDDLTALEQWSHIFLEPKHLVSDIAKSMVFHKKTMDADIAAIKSDWAAAEYFQSGVAAGDLLVTAIGPVEVQPAEQVVGMDLLALPDFAAGFVYGMVGDNNLTEMEACYAGVSPLFTYLDAALVDIEGFHIIKAMEQLEQFVYHFQLDVAPCTAMGDDIQAIEQWAAIFKQPKALISSATKHYLLHKKAITTDIATIKADWDAKSFFASGVAAADLVTVLVGHIE